MSALEVLKGARSLLSEPEHWIKGALAKTTNLDVRDGYGEPQEYETYATDVEANCFCAMGAILHVAGTEDEFDEDAEPALQALAQALDEKYRLRVYEDEDGLIERIADVSDSIPEFNDDDDTKHADVLALFDRAIAAEESR